MGIYASVNGVARKVTMPRVGISGTVRTVRHGFCAVGGTRRQFFGPLEDVTAVEIRVNCGWNYNVDSAGSTSNPAYFTSLTEANRYGSVSISSSSITTQCSMTGKAVCLNADVYALFSDGHEVLVSYLSEEAARYGASISWPVGYDLSCTSYSGDVTGTRWNVCCGTNVYPFYFHDSTYGTTTLTVLTSYFVHIGAGMTSGSGQQYTRMTFGNITIDGRSVPVRVVSQLS